MPISNSEKVINAFRIIVQDADDGRYADSPVANIEEDLSKMLNPDDIWIEITLE